jgi:hypothetical protein
VNVYVAVAKRRAKRLAGAVVCRVDEGLIQGWMLIFYTIVDGKITPFGMNTFPTLEEALAEGNDTLKIAPADWKELPEEQAEPFLLEHAGNRWLPSEYGKGGGRSARQRKPKA